MKIIATLLLAIVLTALPVFAQAADTYTATIGDPVTFTATADGTQPFTYVWKKDGVVISGWVNNTYRIASVKPTDAGVYSAVITNASGTITAACVFTIAIVGPSNGKVAGSKL